MTTAATALLDGSTTPGLYRLLGPVAAVVGSLEAAGWRPVVVHPGVERQQLYAALAGALALPDWFGANLDALADALRDLEVPTALVLTGWTALASAGPDFWAQLLDVLRERTADRPAFAVVLL